VTAALHRLVYEPLVRRALEEDLGRAGDITTDSVVDAVHRTAARVVARSAGTIAGLPIAAAAFATMDGTVEVTALAADGSAVAAGEGLLAVYGPTRAVLSAERVALNFLGRLGGIATATRTIVDAVAGTGVAVTCTRKTTPGWRALEKYAVRCGGGANHRFGLDDAVLIKDNHIAVVGGVTEAIERAKSRAGHLVKVEVEVDTLEQMEEALACGVDAVLLDNMTTDDLRRAVAMAGGRVVLEASGGITPDRAAEVAATGVDVVSLGWLTHSAPALDVGLDVG